MSLSAELERALHYPLADQLPAPGRAILLAPGVKWLRMGLPFALDHINLWLLRDRFQGREGWTVVDCCIDHAESRALWEQVFEHELEGLPVVRVVVTHMHPDHIGLAHWLCERWQAPLWISGTDFQAARYACEVVNSFGGDRLAAYFRSHGMLDEGDLEQVRNRKNYYSGLVPAVPPSYARLIDGMQLTIGGQAWRCVAGYGHAPEHMALYREGSPAATGEGAPTAAGEAPNILISGDMVLPRISTNVSVYEMEPEADSLTLFLDSIDRFKPLPENTLVLPSHGRPFKGLHTRIQQLHDHHRDRLAEVVQAAHARPVSAYDMLPVLFKRPLDLHQTTFALGESVAHLHRLWHGGQLARTLDAAGIWRFAPI